MEVVVIEVLLLVVEVAGSGTLALIAFPSASHSLLCLSAASGHPRP